MDIQAIEVGNRPEPKKQEDERIKVEQENRQKKEQEYQRRLKDIQKPSNTDKVKTESKKPEKKVAEGGGNKYRDAVIIAVLLALWLFMVIRSNFSGSSKQAMSAEVELESL